MRRARTALLTFGHLLFGVTLLGVTLLGVTACSGGGGDGTGAAGTGGAFVILSTEPENNSEIFLNEGLTVRFSRPFELASVNFNSVGFTVRDLSGNPLSEQVYGNFSYGDDGNGGKDRSVLVFDPALPTNDTYSNGGFRPGRLYTASFVQSTGGSNPVIRDLDGRPLNSDSQIKALSFRTRSGSTPSELFRDTGPFGPAVTSVEITPEVGGRVLLNEDSGVPVEVRLTFDQPLDPASSNVPVGQDPDPVKSGLRNQGMIFLEYDDPEYGEDTWIRAQITMPKNDGSGAVVMIRPEGVLPNNAEVRVIVEEQVQDLAGQNNASTIGYSRVVATFRTEESYASRFDALIVNFASTDLLDEEAALRDPVASLQEGLLTASFDFEGADTPFDYRPTAVSTVLNTVSQQVQPVNGLPFTVLNGVFTFRDITIPDGITVQGIGPNPLVFLATGTVRVDGHLSVDGGDGDQVNTLNSANFPTAGGQGICGGGSGGKASQEVTQTTQRGESGYGPGNRRNGGGEGGGVGCSNQVGSGGGGGSHRIQGDDDFYGQTNAKVRGTGGGSKGGKPGPTVVTNSSDQDDFWGTLVNDDGQLVVGELSSPIGGAGGGGGGDRTSTAPNGQTGLCLNAGWLSDEKGAGGGGGAGVLIVKALGPIIISRTGLISADGGRGGGGEQAGGSDQGGGGGGGSGGMVVLMSATRVEFETHGGRWSSAGNWDASFAVSADGNISRNAAWGGNPARLQKYLGAGSWNTGAPAGGGYGGMGIVQLMVPPGDDADGTNDPQDDNILIRQNTQVLTGQAKLDYIYSGDIRPDPVVMPTPFSQFSQARTRWISTGATVRREASTGPRAISPGPQGPEYFFSGLIKDGRARGYIRTNETTGIYRPDAVELAGQVTRAPIGALVSNGAQYRGESAHVLEAGSPLFAAFPNGGLSNYQVRMFDQVGGVLRDFRVLGHDDDTMWLDASSGNVPQDARTFEVLSKFFEVVTNGNEGLGPTYGGGTPQNPLRFPTANVQLGFAFHLDPAVPDLATVGGVRIDRNRYPQALNEFVHNLEDTGALSPREELRRLHYPFVQVMVRFNMDFNDEDPTTSRIGVGPNSTRPALRFVHLPYRY